MDTISKTDLYINGMINGKAVDALLSNPDLQRGNIDDFHSTLLLEAREALIKDTNAYLNSGMDRREPGGHIYLMSTCFHRIAYIDYLLGKIEFPFALIEGTSWIPKSIEADAHQLTEWYGERNRAYSMKKALDVGPDPEIEKEYKIARENMYEMESNIRGSVRLAAVLPRSGQLLLLSDLMKYHSDQMNVVDISISGCVLFTPIDTGNIELDGVLLTDNFRNLMPERLYPAIIDGCAVLCIDLKIDGEKRSFVVLHARGRGESCVNIRKALPKDTFNMYGQQAFNYTKALSNHDFM